MIKSNTPKATTYQNELVFDMRIKGELNINEIPISIEVSINKPPMINFINFSILSPF